LSKPSSSPSKPPLAFIRSRSAAGGAFNAAGSEAATADGRPQPHRVSASSQPGRPAMPANPEAAKAAAAILAVANAQAQSNEKMLITID